MKFVTLAKLQFSNAPFSYREASKRCAHEHKASLSGWLASHDAHVTREDEPPIILVGLESCCVSCCPVAAMVALV